MGKLVPSSFSKLLPAVNKTANQAGGFANQGMGLAKQGQGIAGGGGQPLPPDLKHRLETSFNQDLSDVRVYQDHRPTLAGALAYAQGQDIFFAPGQYHPHTEAGFNLLSHELTHVVQQRAGVGNVSVPNGLAEVLDLADLGQNS